MATQILVKGYMKPYAAHVLGKIHPQCFEDLYAVFPDGRVFVSMAIPCPNPHFDAKGREWHECFELSAETVAKELEYIGQYPAVKVSSPVRGYKRTPDDNATPEVPYDC